MEAPDTHIYPHPVTQSTKRGNVEGQECAALRKQGHRFAPTCLQQLSYGQGSPESHRWRHIVPCAQCSSPEGSLKWSLSKWLSLLWDLTGTSSLPGTKGANQGWEQDIRGQLRKCWIETEVFGNLTDKEERVQIELEKYSRWEQAVRGG